MTFEVTVTADKCIKNQTFHIGPLGFGEKLKVTVSTRCECECDDTNKPHSHCGNNGVVVCGGCRYQLIIYSFLFSYYKKSTF